MLEYFPDPYPDELLYSVWARFGDQMQYQNRNDIVLELFGNSSYHAHVDWSYSLGHLVSQLPVGHDYTVDTLIDDHTLFPLYAPFLPRERRYLPRNQMITGNGVRFQLRMGMLTSHIPHHKWLRYCPECVKNDRDRFGETYWHRLHQVSGVEICPVHATFLEESKAARGPQRQAFLSAEHNIQTMHPRSATAAPIYSSLKDIAECIDQLLHHAYDSPGLLFFQKQYFALLDQHGFITMNGRLRIVEFLNALIEYYSPALLSLLHCGLSHTRHIEAEWPARLPYARKKAQHPLHHILMIRFLGEEIETFLCSPIHLPRPFGNGPWPCLNHVCEQYRTLCIKSYSIREKSLKGRPVGLFVCPSCGFTYSRAGPDRFPEDAFKRRGIPFYGHLWEIKLREWWLDPDTSIECMARHLGVDPITVKRQAKRLGLPPRCILRKGAVKSQDKRRDLEQRRKEWLKLVEEHEGDGITNLIRRKKPRMASLS
jgi:Tn7-like transposition protein D/TniQ